MRTLRAMPQIHLRAEPGDYAPLVLLPGDPNRAERIAERFDADSSRAVNTNRGLLGFTGTYRGVPVSVQTSGMGTPSILDRGRGAPAARRAQLIRVGTCGGIASGMRQGTWSSPLPPAPWTVPPPPTCTASRTPRRPTSR